MPASTPRTTRAALLGTATVGLGATVAGLASAPALGYLFAPALRSASFTPVSLGPASRFTSESGFQPTPVPYSEDAREPATLRGLAYVHSSGGRSPDWLAPDAMFTVFSNRCTHVGCPVQASAIGFSCPCHGSQFDATGDRIAGPAIRPLDRFQWALRDGDLWLTQLWSVLLDHGRARYFPLKSPGQPLAGQTPLASADLLYPADTYQPRRAPGAR